MSDCINGCLTDTFNYINDVCGQLTFALYTLFTFFFFASKLTGWTEPTFTLYVVFVVVVFLTYCPTLTTRHRILVSIFISIIFDVRCQFLHSFHFVLVHFSHATETANYQQWNCVRVCGATLSIFTVSYCPSVRAPQKNKWWHWQLSSLVYLILL